MRQTRLTLPEVALLAGTRVALGAGLALLLSEALDYRERKVAGWGLFLLGAATTVPLMQRVLRQDGEAAPQVVVKKSEV